MTDSKLKIFVFSTNEKWLAQGVERDICVESNTKNDALNRFKKVIEAQASLNNAFGIEALSNIPKTPSNVIKEIKENFNNNYEVYETTLLNDITNASPIEKIAV